MKRVLKKSVVSKPVEKADPRVEAVPVKARRLYIYREGSGTNPEFVKGSIVWVKPIDTSTPESIASAVDFMKKHGAACVIALPFESKNAAVPLKIIEANDAYKDVSAREVVEELLSNVREQQERVRAIVTKAIDEAGL